MKIMKCKSCGIYTLKERCPSCGSSTSSPHPPRFSPLDPYGKYRRMLKRWSSARDGDKVLGQEKVP